MCRLIEKERTPVRLFEPPCRFATAPVNAPRTWPNSSASSSVSGIALQLSATNRCKASRAVVVDGARDDFLPCSGLTGNQERAVGRGHGFQQLKQVGHRAALADDPFEPIALLELRAQVGILGPQPPLLERRIEDVEQLVDLKWLADEIPRAELDGLDRVLQGAVSGDDDGDDVRVTGNGGFNDCGTVDARQSQVRDNDVVREIGEAGDRSLARVRLVDLVAVVSELFGDCLAQRCFIFDEQQMFRAIRHLTGRQHIDTWAAGCSSDWRLKGGRLEVPPIPVVKPLPVRYCLRRRQLERKTISIMKACDLVGVPAHHLQLALQR